MARCKACGADIIFIKTKIGGKMIPCDSKPVYYGPGKEDRVITNSRDVIACKILPDVRGAIGVGYVSHFATCPEADRFRKEK